MRVVAAVLSFVVTAAAIAGFWSWLGAEVAMPESPLAPGEKLACVSYAPFRGEQTPWGAETIAPEQIDEDLGRLKALTDCVRSYSIDHGLDKIPEMARKHGLQVIHGLWLSSQRDLNREQIATTIALAREYPDVIRAVVVGNEVLLRGEMSAAELGETIREVKAALPGMPVTYADVWEFWLRNRDLAGLVDFVTIHILPYWEDYPIPVRDAVPHLASIRGQVVEAFPGKEVLVGETGWPSAGRMRAGALPSPANQAAMLHEALALAKRDGFRINVIEAFDQPWKRRLEGTVGGHWGLFDAYRREAKFTWGEPVSNHPQWRMQAAGGIALAAIVFAASFAGRRRVSLATIVSALAGGTMIGWAVANVPLESLTTGDRLRSWAWIVVAVAMPILVAATTKPATTFATVLDRRMWSKRSPLALLLAASMMLLTVLAILTALGLVFDPRYRDFPFAPMTAAVVPLVAHAYEWWKNRRRRLAQTAAVLLLGPSTIYILFNEGFANWQSLWFCALLAVLTGILSWGRAARD